MRKTWLGLGLFCAISSMAQERTSPIYAGCESTTEIVSCLQNQLESDFKSAFTSSLAQNEVAFEGALFVLVEVNPQGSWEVLFSNTDEAVHRSIVQAVAQLPVAQPARYAGQPTYAKYSIQLAWPSGERISSTKGSDVAVSSPKFIEKRSSSTKLHEMQYRPKDTLREWDEIDHVVNLPFQQSRYSSNMPVPFSHQHYALFAGQVQGIGANNHTASKPYVYSDLQPYFDYAAYHQSLQKNKTSWFGRKLWNEHLVQFQGEEYWFALDFVPDFRVGVTDDAVNDQTYVNTRALRFDGGLGKQLTFTTTVYESQGRFAGYYNQLAESMKPSGGNPAIIPGIGIAKGFKTDGYDFPLAEANLSFTPSRFFNAQLGYGRNFIGDGYRSLLLSDGASPSPYLKLNTQFWKLKYTNLYAWHKDVRPEATVDATYSTKYTASHYLSLNVTKRWNVGFFESVVWSNQNNRGFDMQFVNPIIFYRSVEFGSSSRSGNALMGLTSKYKFSNALVGYGQFLLDEFSIGDVKAGDKSWKNKYGYQLGLQYFQVFGVDGLQLQAEYNRVRPYVYSHSDPLTNYGHNNHSLGHQWGANFSEFIFKAHYLKGRWQADAKITVGERGLDFDNDYNYGSNIYLSYNDDRPFDTQVEVGQGNRASIFIADAQVSYLLNPSNRLKLFGGVIYRNFDPLANTAAHFSTSTTWFQVGLRADLFNWYFDY